MTWDLFVGIKLADTGFQTHADYFLISISKHIRFILQNKAGFRMGKRGGGEGAFIIIIILFWIKKMIRIKNHAHFFPTRYNMQDKNFLRIAYILRVQVRQDYWSSVELHLFFINHRKEKVTLVLIMFRRYLESFSGVGFNTNLSCLLLFYFFFWLRAESKTEWQAFFIVTFLLPHLYGTSIYWD